MPVLPHLNRRAATAAVAAAAHDLASDPRIVESRERIHSTFHAFSTRASNFIAAHLSKRSASCPSNVISNCYEGIDSGPAPGVVAGIVLGSVAGFLLLLWILWILSQGTNFIRTSAVEEEDVVVVRRGTNTRSSNNARRHRSRSNYREEMRERSPRRERVVRQERIIRDRDRVETSIPPPRAPSRIRETIIVEDRIPERRVDGDDVVEVIEEHDGSSVAPPPRRKSRRNSGYR